MNNYKKNLGLFIVFVLILLGGVFLNPHKEILQKNVIETKKLEQKEISVSITAGDVNIRSAVLPGATLYDVLLSKKEALGFSGKSYPSLGFFVTDIGTLHMKSGNNLLYYVTSRGWCFVIFSARRRCHYLEIRIAV